MRGDVGLEPDFADAAAGARLLNPDKKLSRFATVLSGRSLKFSTAPLIAKFVPCRACDSRLRIQRDSETEKFPQSLRFPNARNAEQLRSG